MTDELDAAEQGTVPTPQAGETQDAANGRVLRALRKAGRNMPKAGTPLGDWLNEPGRIHSIRSSE